MADLALTVAQVAPVHPRNAEIYTMIAGAAITKGAAVYADSNGVLQLADASAAGTAVALGIALNAAAVGQPVDVLVRGAVYGFTLTQAYGTEIFLSDTNTGILADAAGTVSVHMGRVIPMSDSAKTKVLFINAGVL